MTTPDEQLLFAWLQRASAADGDWDRRRIEESSRAPRKRKWADGSSGHDDPVCGSTAKQDTAPVLFEYRVCDNCVAPITDARYSLNDLVCVCGAVYDGGRVISADDGAARIQCRSEPSVINEVSTRRNANAAADRRIAHQSYQRGYHFNERIAARQNLEPRIPQLELDVFSSAVHYVLGVPRHRRIPIDLLTPSLLQAVLRAFRPLKPDKGASLDHYAERWVQLRYYIVTGRTERCFERGLEREHPLWDLPWMRDNETLQLRVVFKQLAQCFDELFYRPSKRRFTTKDYRCFASEHDDARHNMLQLNYMIQRIAASTMTPERYEELRIDYCFPTSRSPKARARLDRMYEQMEEHLRDKQTST